MSPRSSTRLPGPGWLSVLGLLAYSVMGEKVVDWAFDRYGDLFGLWVPGIGNVAVLRDPALVKQVMVASAEDLDSTEGQRVTEVAYGPQSLFLLDGPEHRRLRKLLLPPFRGDAMGGYREAMVQITERSIGDWPVGEPFALLPHMHRTMLETILRVVVGIDDPDRLREWAPPMQGLLDKGLSEEMAVRYGLRHVGGLRLWRSFHRLRDQCDQLIFTEIGRRRHAGQDRDDILGLMMRARDQSGRRLTDVALRDQVMTLLLAGHETTATSLAWAIERLIRHPGALARLTAEATGGTGDAYAAAIAHEVLRIRPPVAGIARVVRRPYQLGGHTLAPGTTIVPHIRALHENPDLYPDPHIFRPERFLDSKPAGYTWIPFGGGPHMCLGNHFALMQIKTVLHTIARRTTLTTADPADEPIKRKAIVNLPAHGCRVILQTRLPRPLTLTGQTQEAP